MNKKARGDLNKLLVAIKYHAPINMLADLLQAVVDDVNEIIKEGEKA